MVSLSDLAAFDTRSYLAMIKMVMVSANCVWDVLNRDNMLEAIVCGISVSACVPNHKIQNHEPLNDND